MLLTCFGRMEMSGDMLNNLPYFLYMMEQEGHLNSRSEKIEKFIEILAAADDPNDAATQDAAFNAAGLRPGDLTSADNEYIIQEVERRM